MNELMYQRDVYGKTLVELGKSDDNIVVFDADLSGSTRTSFFSKEFPDRFSNFGVAEQNMMATAAGFASCGKIVFASTFAMFATGRAWDQVRNSICYSRMNVKIVATHAGVTVGPDGATHQALEDMALMQAIPNMKVIVPCDGPETREAVLTAAKTSGPLYVRLGRSKVPTIEGRQEFKLGKAYSLTEGDDITIFACGFMVHIALNAATELAKKGIACEVVNVASVKPINAEYIVQAASKTKGMVICEEHSTFGGLGTAIEQVLIASSVSKPVKRIGVNQCFGQSGSQNDLLRIYNLTDANIIDAAKSIIKG